MAVKFVPEPSLTRQQNSSAHGTWADKAGDGSSGHSGEGVPVQLPCLGRAPHFGRSSGLVMG